MIRTLSAVVCLVVSTTTAIAQQHHCTGPQVGTWTLNSIITEYQDTGQKVERYGAHPTGFLSYGPDCRMYAIVAREGRKAPTGIVPTDAEKIDLFDGVLAYAGTYTIEGDNISHHVDISSNESWTGTTQVRQFKIEGNTLHIRSVPAINPRDGRLSSSSFIWTRVQ